VAEFCFVAVAVAKGETTIAKTALTGSLISNCLVIFGTCLLFGGIMHDRQYYPIVMARANAQLLGVSLVSITVPTAFKIWSEGKLSDTISTRLEH
jgi:Ca2+:H+ antiporter